MKKFVLKSVLMAVGISGMPVIVSQAGSRVQNGEAKENDPRLARLRRFFRAVQSPLEHLAGVFISEADRHGLDWRLLPGLCLVESGGGRVYKGNNVFGWNNGNSSFGSIREGIQYVASRLAESRTYRHKNVTEKLAAYNPDVEYARTVKSVMLKISDGEGLD